MILQILRLVLFHICFLLLRDLTRECIHELADSRVEFLDIGNLFKHIDKFLIEDQYLLLEYPILTGSWHLTHLSQEKVYVLPTPRLNEVSKHRNRNLLIIKQLLRSPLLIYGLIIVILAYRSPTPHKTQTVMNNQLLEIVPS